MRTRHLVPFLAASALALPATAASADEGMWTFDAFPTAQMKADYGFAPDQAWLDRVQAAAVRLTGGCSASFVSATGLILTNHHCVVGCLQNLSTGESDLVAGGINTATLAEGAQVPGPAGGGRDLHHRRDRDGRRCNRIGHRRGPGQGARRGPGQAGVGRRLHEHRHRPLPGRDALRRRAVQALQIPQVFGRPRGLGAPSSRRRSSAATPTTSTSRATRSMRRSCAPMRTTARSRHPPT